MILPLNNIKYSCIYYADGSTDPSYIKLMYEKLVKQNLDLIFASRYEKNAYSYDDDFNDRGMIYIISILINIEGTSKKIKENSNTIKYNQNDHIVTRLIN